MMVNKVLTDEEKYLQTQHNLEKELQALKSEYFVLDKSYTHSQFSQGSVLVKGEKIINIFLKEHFNILTDLTRAAAPGRKYEDEKMFEHLTTLLEEYKSFDRKVKDHKTYIKELIGEMKLSEKDVQSYRQQQTTDRQYENRVRHAIKTLEALENKLETQMIQFGTICTKNKNLRYEIDHLLSQRQVFMTQWTSLIDKLSEGKKIMLDLIEQATIAYNQREEWCTKLQILRRKAHQDMTNNMQNMREYKRRLDETFKFRQFLLTKGQKRVMKTLQQKEKEKWKKSVENLEEKLAMYHNMLDNISEFTKGAQTKVIAAKFRKHEEMNLSNFKFVVDMLSEMESMNDRLGFLLIDIDERFVLHQTRDNQQKHKLEELELDLENNTAEAGDAKKLMDETDTHFNALLQGIESLFKICKCDKDPFLRLLGDNRTIRFYNVRLYIKLLETRIHWMLITAGHNDKVKKLSENKKILPSVYRKPQIYPIEKIVISTPCSLCVEHEMVSDVIDTLQHVWSKAEAKSKLRYRLKLPEGKARLHTISHCQLPKARQMMQRRYE